MEWKFNYLYESLFSEQFNIEHAEIENLFQWFLPIKLSKPYKKLTIITTEGCEALLSPLTSQFNITKKRIFVSKLL